jgi:hypothetical protein
LRPMLQPGQTLLQPASTFFISIFASFHQTHSPAALKKLKRVYFLPATVAYAYPNLGWAVQGSTFRVAPPSSYQRDSFFIMFIKPFHPIGHVGLMAIIVLTTKFKMDNILKKNLFPIIPLFHVWGRNSDLR